MSARSFKIYALVATAHILVFSLVWIGFTAPNPRPAVIYTYEGALPLEEMATGETWQKRNSEKLVFDHLEKNYDPWVQSREPSKPLIYDHLGF